MPMSVHGAVVLGFANKSWLGNQHGKQTSATEKRFLCLATGKNLVCFFCFYVMLLWSLEQRGHYKKGGNLLLSNNTNLAWKLLCRDLCGWAQCLPLTGPGADRGWGPSRSQFLVSPLPHTAAGDLQHFLSREGWEWTVFMKWTWPRKAFSTISSALESSAVLPIIKCPSSCLLEHSLNQRTRSLPGEQQHIFGTEPPQWTASIST